MAKKNLTPEEKNKREIIRQKKALKSYKHRTLKNLIIWFIGCLSSLIFLFTSLFIGLKVIPISTYTGGVSNDIVSEKISSKSIIDALMEFNTYKLSDMPVVFDMVEDIIDNAGLGDYVEIDKDKLKDLKIGGNLVEGLDGVVKVTATLDSLGGDEILGDLYKLDVFSSWKVVSAQDYPVDENNDGIIDKNGEEFKSNPKLYYYQNSSSKYVRAYDDEGVINGDAVGKTLVYPNLGQIPVLEVTHVLSDSFATLEINNLLSTFGAGEIFEESFIGEILNGKTLSQLTDISESDIYLTDILGEYNEDTKSMYDILCSAVKTDPKPTASELTVGHLTNGLDVGAVPLGKVAEGMDPETLDLLLTVVNDGLPESEKLSSSSQLTVNHISGITSIKISSFLPYSKGSVDNSMVYKILLEGCGTDTSSMTPQEIENAANALTIDALESFDFNNVDIESILEDQEILLKDFLGDYSSNKVIYDVLCSAVIVTPPEAQPTHDTLSINHLRNGFNFDKVGLTTVMPNIDSSILTILFDAVNGKLQAGGNEILSSKDDLTLNHISSIETKYIKLTSVLQKVQGEGGNSVLFDVLLDAINGDKQIGDVGYVSENDITIEHLSSFTFNKVKLNKVLPVSSNADLYSVLCDAINGDKQVGDVGYVSDIEITIAHLSSFTFNKVKLSTVLPIASNIELYNVLCDAINGNKQASDSGYVNKNEITIEHLSSFTFNKVKLNTVLPISSNADLYNVLLDAINGNKQVGDVGYVSESDITIEHFNGFSISNVHLKTFMSSSTNPMMSALIEKNVTVGNLSTAINSLSLYEVYGNNCFVESNATGVPKYSKSGNTYTLDAEGQYVISNNAGIWLLLCFDAEGVTATGENAGCRTTYTVSSATVEDLQGDGSGTDISSKLTHATVRELVLSGILPSANALLYTKTLQEALNVGA